MSFVRNFCTMSNIAKLPAVDIDPQGVFKYILIQAKEGVTQRLILRGYKRCKFHADILADVESREGAGKITFDCPGGGRIKHEPEKKSLLVYGYSQGFGRADHTKAVELLKEKYPDYKIEWSNEGY